MVDAYIGKTYKLATSENFDEFMKALGVGLMTRKVGGSLSPVVELQKDGDQYIINLSSPIRNIITKFTPGQEFDDETADGRKIKATITIDGNTLKEVHTDKNGKVTYIDRTFSDDEVRMDLKVDNITALRIYKRQ